MLVDAYTGEIRMFAGNYAPAGWAFCDGSTLHIGPNQALFSLLGTSWGGDGINTFCLPDLRGRLPIGQGTGPGLTTRTFGQTGGTETVTLTVAQVPSHNHSVNATTTPATTAEPAGNILAAPPPPAGTYATKLPSPSKPQILNSGAISPAGGNQPHQNVMQTFVVNFIICTNGIFPTRP